MIAANEADQVGMTERCAPRLFGLINRTAETLTGITPVASGSANYNEADALYAKMQGGQSDMQQSLPFLLD